jgi:hypothetical protein
MSPKNLIGLCLELESLTFSEASDPDLAYLHSLCLPPEEKSKRLGELLKLWPNQPWLNRAAGWELFAQDDLDGALWYLDQAFESDPTTLLPELETLARLRHLHGLPASTLAEDFNFWVPGLATLTNRESTEKLNYLQLSHSNQPPNPTLPDQDLPYVLLNQGQLEQALALTKPGELQDRLIRLAGASNMATEDLVEQALSLPSDRGLDRDTAWAMLGLALRHGRPTADYEKVIIDNSPPPANQITQAIKAKDMETFNQLILGRDAWLQGQACLAAELAGLKLPEKCPFKARGFLFVGEKPALPPLPPQAKEHNLEPGQGYFQSHTQDPSQSQTDQNHHQ